MSRNPRIGADEEEHIDETNDQNKDRDRRKHPDVLLPVLLEKEQERESEVEQDQDHTDPEPAGRHSGQIPARLLRNIAGVNDKKLRKIEVSPDHHEGEYQFTDVVQ